MIISRNLLEEFIDLKGVSNQAIAQTLTDLGFETTIKADYQKLDQQLLVAKVIKKERNPDFQKIYFCQADLGKGEVVPVVCGAENFQLGAKVVYVPVGVRLNPDWKIKKRKFGGFVSYGMFCSWEDLGLATLTSSEEKEGIIVLPQAAKIGENYPLKYRFASESLFKITLPWNQPEYKNIFLLTSYLAKQWPKKWTYQLASYPATNQEKKIPLPPVADFPWNYWGESRFKLATSPVNYQKLIQLLKIHNLEVSHHFDQDLITYLQLEFPTLKLKIKSATSLSDKKARAIIFFSSEEEKANQPKATLSMIGQQRFNYLYSLYSGIKVNYHYHSREKFYQEKEFDRLYLENILGKSFTKEEIITILAKSDYQLLALRKNKLKLKLPGYHQSWTTTELAREIIRWSDYQIIGEQPLIYQGEKINFQPDFYLEKKLQLTNYLLGENLKQVKNLVFWEKAHGKEKAHQLINNRKLNYLQTSLIPNLLKKKRKFIDNLFTFDKVFHQEGEREHLAIIWEAEWLKNPLYQEKIHFNKMVLVAMITNILQIWKLRKAKLLIKKNQLGEKLSPYLQADKKDPLLSDCGYEKFFYEKTPLGEWGEIVEELGHKTSHYFYLELDLTALEKSKNGEKSFLSYQKESTREEIFWDINLVFSQGFRAKIYCQIKNQTIIECNHYQHIINKIKSCDRKITKIEVIDHYQKKQITLRIWKNIISNQERKEKKLLFTKVEKILKNWKEIN